MSLQEIIQASSLVYELEGQNNSYNNYADGLLESAVGQDYHDSTQFDYRTLFRFGIPTIPQGSQITKVNMRMVATQDLSGVDFNVQIRKLDWSAMSPGSTAYAAAISATLDQIWRSTSGLSVGTQYTSPDLDVLWVQAFLDAGSSYYYYSIVSSRDAAGNTPSGNEYIQLGARANATSAYRPVLIVEYDPPGQTFSMPGFIGA